MTVTARLKVSHITDYGPHQRDVHFNAVYSDDPKSPNYSFSKATPCASLTLCITNPDAFNAFQSQETYDVVLNRVEEPLPVLGAALKAAALAALMFLGSIGLSACSALSSVVPPAPQDPAQAIYELKAGLVVTESAELTFAQQVCPVASSCNDSRVTALVKASFAADAAVSAAEAAVNTPTISSTAAQQAVTAAQNALTAFQAILTQYGVKVSSTTNGSS